jgi:hypothetical protein
MAAAVAPAISLGTQLFASRRANKAQTAATQALGQLRGAAGDLSATGGGLLESGRRLLAGGAGAIGRGTQFLGQAAGYYAPILAGNRASIASSLAPERGQITDIYRGASRGLDRSGIRGADRELAEAELTRQKAGQLAGLAPLARAGAAQALTGIGAQEQGTGLGLTSAGTNLSGQGVSAKSAGTSALSAALGVAQGRANVERGHEMGIGQATGGLLFDALKSQGGRKATPTPAAAPGFGSFVGYAPTVPMYRP